MHFSESLGLFELEDQELGRVTGSFMSTNGNGYQAPGRGGEVHAEISGPPMRGEIGASCGGPFGSRIGGSFSSDGRGWMAGVSGAFGSSSGRTNVSGSAYTDGHDWGVTGKFTHRFLTT